MDCLSFIVVLHGIPRCIITLIQVYNVLIGVLNITGNTILIWGLRKTRQTKTISFQFIAIMSVSDLTIGIFGILFLTLLSTDPYQNYCWMKLLFQAVIATCNYFSAMMVLLVAFDRYLHMKYLEQYSTKLTKRRGYFLVVASLAFVCVLNAIFTAPLTLQAFSIMKFVFFSLSLLFPFLTMLLYGKAMHAMKTKANQITRGIINDNRTLGRAAKRVSMCFLMLTVPTIIINIMEGANMQVSIIDQSVASACSWFAYITFLANGFCSSIIFISQNMPIQRILKRTIMANWQRIQSDVGATQLKT